MSEQTSLDLPLPEFKWSGDVQLQLASNTVEVGAELFVQLMWASGSDPGNCHLSLKNGRGAVVLSQPISVGTFEARVQVPADVEGTHTLELMLGGWVLAEERVEVLRREELGVFNSFIEAVSFRDQAAKAADWEETVRYDELAADAYEKAGAEDVAISCLFDVAKTTLHRGQFNKAREAVLRAVALARKSNDVSALVRALYYLGEVDVKLDRTKSAIAALDQARILAENLDMDLIAVKSSALLCRYALQTDNAIGRRYYRALMPKLAFAFSPAAQAEALILITDLKEFRALESLTAFHLSGSNSWLAHCDFRSGYLSQHANISRIADVVVPWEASTDSFANALVKRLVTSFSKFLIEGFNLDVILAVEAKRSISGEFFKVGLRDIYISGIIGRATDAWFRSDDFLFIAKLTRSLGGAIHTEFRHALGIVELSFPDQLE